MVYNHIMQKVLQAFGIGAVGLAELGDQGPVPQALAHRGMAMKP